MKRIIAAFITIIAMVSIGLGDVTVDTRTKNGYTKIYFHATSDPTTNIKVAENFYGTIYDVFIVSIGTEAAYDVVLLVDPIEIGAEEQVHTLIMLETFSNLVGGTSYFYVHEATSKTTNTFGGFVIAGADIYIGTANITWGSGALTDLKVYLNCGTN